MRSFEEKNLLCSKNRLGLESRRVLERNRRSLVNLSFLSIFLLLSLAPLGCFGFDAPTEETPIGQPIEAPAVVQERCEEQTPCRRNIDCPAGGVCRGQQENEGEGWGCCQQFLCETDQQCPQTETCDLQRQLCIPLDICVVDEVNVCALGEECLRSERDVRCEDPQSQGAVFSCSLDQERLTGLTDVPRNLQMAIFDDEGALLPYPDASFDASAPIGTIEEDVWIPQCDGPTPCEGTLELRHQGQRCGEVEVVAFPVLAPGDFRVVVEDGHSGEAVSGEIYLRITGEADLRRVVLDDDGVAFIGGLMAGSPQTISQEDIEAVSFMSDTFDWMTYLRPTSSDLRMSVTRSKVMGRNAGFKGATTRNEYEDLQVTLAGASFDDAQAMGPLAIFGASDDVDVDLDGTTSTFVAAIPRALFIRMGETPITTGFIAQSEPGARLPWSLGHFPRLADVGATEFGQRAFAGQDLSEEEVVQFFFDHQGRNQHGFAPTRILQLQNTSGEVESSSWAEVPFVEIDDDELEHFFAAWWSTTLPVPTLPCLKTDPTGCVHNARGAMVMSAVQVPGRGMVPLALNNANDDVSGEGQLDGEVQSLAGEARKISLTTPPPHDGLEGYPTTQIIFAWDPDDVSFSRLSTSALVRVGEDLRDERPIASTFVQVQSGKIYGEEVRLFEHFLRGDADIFRAELEGDDGKWTLYYDREYAERIQPLSLSSLHPVEKKGREKSLALHAMRLLEESPEDARSFSSVGLKKILPLLDGWSHVSCETSADGNSSTCGDFE